MLFPSKISLNFVAVVPFPSLFLDLDIVERLAMGSWNEMVVFDKDLLQVAELFLTKLPLG